MSGVKYLKGGAEHFQPAKAVLLGGYAYENTRLLLLSRSSAYPNGLSNNHGQVGRHYMSHGLRSIAVQGLFPGRDLNRYGGSGSQWTAIDDWDADNFDHNERHAAVFLQQKGREWLLEAGASETWTTPPAPIHVTTHAYGGTRMGDDTEANVADRWCFSHEAPNLGVLGASNFPTSGGRNPTETVMALAWRTAEHLVETWSDRTG